jgi:hypothetical protein
MTDIFQIENIKLFVLFALIAAVIVMSHFGAAAPARQKTRRGAKSAPATV